MRRFSITFLVGCFAAVGLLVSCTMTHPASIGSDLRLCGGEAKPELGCSSDSDCSDGLVCVAAADACFSSSCSCSDDGWLCTSDCIMAHCTDDDPSEVCEGPNPSGPVQVTCIDSSDCASDEVCEPPSDGCITRPCICGDGQWLCSHECAPGNVCQPAGEHCTEEVCDGVDNDCDGEIDEELLSACGECAEVPVETCDGVDNNCDGETDEGDVCFVMPCPDVPEGCYEDADCDLGLTCILVSGTCHGMGCTCDESEGLICTDECAPGYCSY